MKELHKSGRTVLVITHDPEIAAQAERVIRIKDGKITEDYRNDIENGKTTEDYRNDIQEGSEDV